jgi:hypothetical protein
LAPAGIQAGPSCPFRAIGVDPILANAYTGPVFGEAIGQTFVASDTLIRSITIWRAFPDVVNYAGIKLYVTKTDTSGRPDSRRVIHTGPTLFIPIGDEIQPTAFVFTFDPPLALPHRGRYCFALQSYGLLNTWAALSNKDNPFADGLVWITPRSDGGLMPFTNDYPQLDLAFRIEFVNPALPIPVMAVAANPVPCHQQLSWAFQDGGVSEAMVFRRTGNTDWVTLAQVSPAADGRLAYDDTTITPGEFYYYRLGLQGCGEQPLYGRSRSDRRGLGIRLVDYQVAAGHLHLHWSSTGGTDFVATVFRREAAWSDFSVPDTTWRVVGAVRPDELGRMNFDDVHITGGGSYHYRLGVPQCGRMAYLGRGYFVTVPCGVEVPELSGETRTCEVDLAWSLPDSAYHTAMVYKRRSGGDWFQLGLTGSDRIGRSTVIDQTVVPGTYSYRLGVETRHCKTLFCNELTVEVPSVQAVAGTPTLFADHVVLTWTLDGMVGASAMVFRRKPGADWEPLNMVVVDSFGRVRYEDSQVPGESSYGYSYRLVTVQCGAEVVSGEIQIQRPPMPKTALLGVRPNPSSADLRIAFTLPDDGPARVEVMDLSGRRILARELGAFGPGEHELDLNEGKAMPSGIYLVRFTRGNYMRTVRGVVIR